MESPTDCPHTSCFVVLHAPNDHQASSLNDCLACCSAASSTLRWAVSRSAVPGVAAKTHRNGETKNKERSVDIKKILKVESGTGQFPGSNSTKGQKGRMIVCQ